MISAYLGQLRDIPRVLTSEQYGYATSKEVSECSVRVWQGSKLSKPRCDGPGLPGRSAAVNEMFLRFRDARHHNFCLSSRQTGETKRECCKL